MTEDRIAAPAPPRRYRYWIDIVVLVAVVFGSNWIADRIFPTTSMEAGFTVGGAIQMLQVAFAWLLIRWRGETLGDIGLKRPRSWPRTIVAGIVTAIVLFVGIYFSERAGFHRDLSRFAPLQGNMRLTFVMIVYVFIGAGFYEEFMYRGFLMQGLAMSFGGSRAAWAIACAIQGIVFGLSHAYQNPLGMLITGTFGILFAILVFAFGRNLWPAIIAHGVFDASRCVLFYFQGPPGG